MQGHWRAPLPNILSNPDLSAHVSQSLPTQQPAQPFAKATRILSPLLTNAGSPLSRVSVWSTPTHDPEVWLPAIASWTPASLLLQGVDPQICLVLLSHSQGC